MATLTFAKARRAGTTTFRLASLADAQGNEVKCALGSDLTCRQMPGATRFRSFWYKDE